jgi:2-keto-3-deoxy-L-rhamnonate aldolase RhmA
MAKTARRVPYPPLGRRGSGAGLASFTWPEAGNYYDSADTNILVVAMIEEASAVQRIDEIAAIPGIDVLFIGTSDLSFSLGLRGRQHEPVLQEEIRKVAAAAKRHGKFLPSAGTAEQITRFREEGSILPIGHGTRVDAAWRAGIAEAVGYRGIPPERRALY